MINLSLKPQIGAVAGWKLELTPVAPGKGPTGKTRTYSSDDYRGSVDATLVSGLSAGSFTVVVEDVSEQDYKELIQAASSGPLQARLFLVWLDAPRPSLGADGLVAVLRVTALRRRVGKWRYEMVVDGREWVYDLMIARCPQTNGENVKGDGALGAAVNLAHAQFVELDPPPAPVADTEKRETDHKLRGIEQMRDFEKEMVAKAAQSPNHRAGLGMYLIRDGKLRLGPDRLGTSVTPARLDGDDSGLLAIERNGAVREDDTPVGIDDGNPEHRDLFVVTLRGRPDLKPGDIVEFKPPERGALGEDLGFALGPAPQAIKPGEFLTAYVQEVSHRLSREQGFLTVLRCVGAASGEGELVERLWFDGAAADSAGAGGSSESFVTRILSRASDAVRTDRLPDVAQVRAQHLQGGDPPALTERLWRGLEEPDGVQFAAGRQPFAKVKKELASAPYATPFAYGPWGLVLPRYPGTRVLVVNRAGDPNDPVDVGALWSRGAGPPAEMGDWWLSLPVDLDGDQGPRASVEDNDAAAAAQSGDTTNDLIDAHGNRVIEVGKLTIRIGKSNVPQSGARPIASDDPVTIDLDGGKASITIAKDGAMTISTTKGLTLKASQDIALETDGSVNIAVRGKVNVGKKT